MSKIGAMRLDLDEQAERLGFEDLEMALANGYEVSANGELVDSKLAAIRRRNLRNQLASRKRDPEKWHARSTVSHAIRDGKIKRKPCEECGEEPAQAHHDDYSKPLEVRWLCKECHRKWHLLHREER